jgi:hypothetical protein
MCVCEYSKYNIQHQTTTLSHSVAYFGTLQRYCYIFTRTLPSKKAVRGHFVARVPQCARVFNRIKEHFDAHPIRHDADKRGDARNGGVFNRSFLQLLPNGLFRQRSKQRLFGRCFGSCSNSSSCCVGSGKATGCVWCILLLLLSLESN